MNRCQTSHSRMRIKGEDGTKDITPAELENGAISICRAFDGVYQDPANPKVKKKVNGDLTKVRWATCLTPAGTKL